MVNNKGNLPMIFKIEVFFIQIIKVFFKNEQLYIHNCFKYTL